MSRDDETLPVSAMTIDVEDYFQVSAMAPYVSRAQWETLESRVCRNVEKALELFAESNTKATFFFLGWVAERFPELVKQVAVFGHEVASHGYEHTKVSTQSAEEFLEDARHTRLLLEDISGQPVNGYRAASFSIDESTPWAHDILAQAGYRYSSSVYPVSHDHYGMPGAPRWPHKTGSAGLLEIPMTTVRLFGRNWPASGGGYFRLFPRAVSTWGLGRVIRKEGRPAVFYFHPWELDPDQPRVADLGAKARFRHYLNLHKFEGRLRTVLAAFPWGRMDEIFLGD
jgi:polysaccharide deacetylase family protein (PEP-CTERM system associated)